MDAELTIAAVANRCGLPESTLRYWERIGLTPPVQRDPSSGHRRYREEDVVLLETLANLRAVGWTVAALAAEVRLSRAAFATRFTELVGEPPLRYLTGWRMAVAADLLRDTDETVAAVARRVGYSDAFAFSVAFKRARGTSPSAWRR